MISRVNSLSELSDRKFFYSLIAPVSTWYGFSILSYEGNMYCISNHDACLGYLGANVYRNSFSDVAGSYVVKLPIPATNVADAWRFCMEKISSRYENFRWRREGGTSSEPWTNALNALSRPVLPDNILMHSEYDSGITFSGILGYHRHKTMSMPDYVGRATRSHYRMGVELEVQFPSTSARESFVSHKSNIVYCEHDCSIGGADCEIITVPLQPRHARSLEFWRPIVDAVNAGRGKSWDARTCGLHVHVERKIMGDTPEKQSDAIGRLLYLYYYVLSDDLKVRVFGRDTAMYCEKMTDERANAAKVLGDSVLRHKSVRDHIENSMKNSAAGTRSYHVNLCNEHTIEFRQGRGTLNLNRICAVTELVELICRYAVSEKNISKMSETKFIDYVNTHAQSGSTLIGMMSGDR